MYASIHQSLLRRILSIVLARQLPFPRRDRRTAFTGLRILQLQPRPAPRTVIGITEGGRYWQKTATVAGGNSFSTGHLHSKPFSPPYPIGSLVSPATPPTPATQIFRLRPRIGAVLGSLLAASLALQGGAARAGGTCADVALVLAIDGSASIDATEFDLQKRGYQSALTDPRIQDVFATAGVVDIAAVFWADSGFRPQIIPFQRITSAPEVAHFAQTLVDLDRDISGNTDLAKGLSTALDLLAAPGGCAERLLIDVSSDGRASLSTRLSPRGSLSQVRARAEEMGVVINALVIDSAGDNLADYYRRNVAVGSRSFVMDVGSFESFHTAIATKLLRELLSGIPENLTCVARAVMARSARMNCRV
jgi:hypothetical protein